MHPSAAARAPLLASACAVPTIATLSARGDVALVGGAPAAHVLTVAAGLAIAAAALRPGPDVRRTPLVAASAAWLAAEWASPGAPGAVFFTAGLLAASLTVPLLLLSARLSGAVGRLTVGLATAGALGVGFVSALIDKAGATGCTDCPADLLALADRRDLAADVARAGAWFLAAACAVAFVALATRAIRRRATVPGAIALFVAAAGVEAFALARDGQGTSSATTAHLAGAAALALVAVATQGHALRAARARRLVASALRAEQDEETFRRTLARVAGVEHAELYYWAPGFGWRDHDGHAVSLPPEAVILADGDDPLVALIAATGAPNRGLLAAAASAARLRLDADRLQVVVRARLEELRIARRRVAVAADEARRSLERDLHDGAQQQLAALRFGLELARRGAPPEVVARLDEADSALEHALHELRELGHGLYPGSLDNDGLVVALAAAAERAGTPVKLGAIPPERFPSAVERTAYRVVADALREAKFAVQVDALHKDGSLIIRVNGGREFRRLLDAPLADQVAALDGELRVGRDGALEAELPCA